MPLDHETLRRLYVDEHRSQKAIAAEFGVSQRTVSRRLAALGIGRDRQRAGPRLDLFAIPADLSAEHQRVLRYINGEIERVGRGERTEPVDLITGRAREILAEHERRTRR